LYIYLSSKIIYFLERNVGHRKLLKA